MSPQICDSATSVPEFYQEGLWERDYFGISDYRLGLSSCWLLCIFKVSKDIYGMLNFMHLIGLLALTTGPGKQASEILEESVPIISQALRSRSESSKVAAVSLVIDSIIFRGDWYIHVVKYPIIFCFNSCFAVVRLLGCHYLHRRGRGRGNRAINADNVASSAS